MPPKYRKFFPPGGSPKEPGRAVGIAEPASRRQTPRSRRVRVAENAAPGAVGIATPTPPTNPMVSARLRRRETVHVFSEPGEGGVCRNPDLDRRTPRPL